MVNEVDLILDFVNTLHKDPAGNEEGLTSPAALGAWLHDRGLLEGKRATAAELARAIELREALRRLLLANNEVEVDVEPSCLLLEATSKRAGLGLRFKAALPYIAPTAGGVDGALGKIVVAMQVLVADGTWPRLKACRAADCEWAFIDNAKNQSRAWCSMRSCGNREKARAFRARHAHETGAAPAA